MLPEMIVRLRRGVVNGAKASQRYLSDVRRLRPELHSFQLPL